MYGGVELTGNSDGIILLQPNGPVGQGGHVPIKASAFKFALGAEVDVPLVLDPTRTCFSDGGTKAPSVAQSVKKPPKTPPAKRRNRDPLKGAD